MSTGTKAIPRRLHLEAVPDDAVIVVVEDIETIVHRVRELVTEDVSDVSIMAKIRTFENDQGDDLLTRLGDQTLAAFISEVAQQLER
jgi:hypothetical protein